VAPIHVAPTREQAWAEAAEGVWTNLVTYLRMVGGQPMNDILQGVETPEQALKLWTTKGMGIFGVLTVGTPDDVAASVQRLLDQTGGYGCFLALAHNAANWEATKRSYELFARHVIPRFQCSDRRRESAEWLQANSGTQIPAMVTAMSQSFAEHEDLLPQHGVPGGRR
jgi:limonene 1,2-monooxygenase